MSVGNCVDACMHAPGVGATPAPKHDLHRFVKWPKYVRIQRQRRVLNQRLKVSLSGLSHLILLTSACSRPCMRLLLLLALHAVQAAGRRAAGDLRFLTVVAGSASGEYAE